MLSFKGLKPRYPRNENYIKIIFQLASAAVVTCGQKNAYTPCHKTKGQVAGVVAVRGRVEFNDSLLSYFTEVTPLKMFHKCEYHLSSVLQ